jgi:hypothetical protein
MTFYVIKPQSANFPYTWAIVHSNYERTGKSWGNPESSNGKDTSKNGYALTRVSALEQLCAVNEHVTNEMQLLLGGNSPGFG